MALVLLLIMTSVMVLVRVFWWLWRSRKLSSWSWCYSIWWWSWLVTWDICALCSTWFNALALELGGGPFQKSKSYPHFLMLWSLYNRYLTLKIVSLQNQVPVRPNHFFWFSAKIGHLRGFPTFSQMLLWSPKYLFLSLLIKSNVASHIT